MQHNQICLSKKPIKKNKQFLKLLYGAEDLEGYKKSFEKLDCSISLARDMDDSDMTLEKFLDLMTGKLHIMLQIGSPIMDKIRYTTCTLSRDVDKFFMVECSYNEPNYSMVSQIFKQVYGLDLDSIPVPEALKLYHQKFGF